MKIRFLGHACFLLTRRDGKTLLMDPFDPAMGYPVPRGKVDVVTASHGHHDHNYVDELDEGFSMVTERGAHQVEGFSITGIKSYHDEVRGAKRGENLIYIVEAEGLRIAHLGDLGHLPDEVTMARLQNLDVLLLPIGGFYTIDAQSAEIILRASAPKLTIPMHYQMGVNDLPIADEKAFMARVGGQSAGACEIDVPGEWAGVVALDFGR